MMMLMMQLKFRPAAYNLNLGMVFNFFLIVNVNAIS